MAARSLNKVQLIGNLTRDPELRYTPQGTAVCTFGIATNRYWVTESGEKREEAEFHRVVAWNKLAELCAQLLFKGRRIYVEGRLQTRTWTGQDGAQRQATEIVIEDMIVLDSRRLGEEGTPGQVAPVSQEAKVPADSVKEPVESASSDKKKKDETKESKEETVVTDKKEESKVEPEDIPF